MSEVPDGDWQRWQDELQRCVMLSLDTPLAFANAERTRVECREIRYYAERHRILSLIGPERAVVFLREETLRALAGKPRDGAMTRWLRLHSLEFGGSLETITGAPPSPPAPSSSTADPSAGPSRWSRRPSRTRFDELWEAGEIT